MIEDKPRDECGIVAVYGHPEAAKLVYLGLYALQHRGQESAGIVASDGRKFKLHKGQGLVADAFTEKDLDRLQGHMAIGHVRYSTTGSNTLANAQPIAARYHGGYMAIAHNGNIINARELRRELEGRGAIFQSSNDSEVLSHLLAQISCENFEDALTASITRVKGAYSLAVIHDNQLFALKDPRGIRPLCIGALGDATVIASESCALDLLDAQYIKELRNGEMVVLEEEGVRVENPMPPAEERYCVFENIYFSRPDSMRGNRSIAAIRNELGRQLAREHPADADIVIAVPDSSNAAGLGYAEESGLPFKFGLIRNHYVGRTFIEPEEAIRHFGAKIKFNPARSVVRDQRVVLVDDSIVRGTNGKKVVAMLRKAGAREVHFRVSSPPLRNSCYYGIDIPDAKKLIANANSIDRIARFMDADSVGYLSIEGMLNSMPKKTRYCTACFTGQYDAGRPKEFKKSAMEQELPKEVPAAT